MNIRQTKWVIFTDLDGTLLDEKTYRASTEALEICKNSGFAVVFVSSKTMAEIEKLRMELDNRDPFVSENGGGVFLPVASWKKPEGAIRSGHYWLMRLGTDRRILLSRLREAARAAGVEVKGFSDMDEHEIASLTGLPPEDVRLAQRRQFDEPFIIINENPEAIQRIRQEIEKTGLKYARGGRFHHITGTSDKGHAVSFLRKLYTSKDPSLRFAAIGDTSQDTPMLKAADMAFLVRRPNGEPDPEAVQDGIIVTKGIGPEGFKEVVAFLSYKL